MKKIVIKSYLFFAITMLSFACKKDEASPPTAYVAIINTCANGPAINVSANGAAINNTAIAYNSKANYIKLPIGNDSIKILNSLANNQIIASANITAIENKRYSIFVVDTFSLIKTIIAIDTFATITQGNSLVRFINTSADKPIVDVAAENGGIGSILFPNSTSKQLSEFSMLNSEIYNFIIYESGTTNILVSLNNITLASGKAYTIYLQGYSGARPIGNQNVLSVGIIQNN
jgi:Domain of unknown function (DUF4397)